MISMIWAEDLRHGIGKRQSIPWHIPGDMAFLRKPLVETP
ncbi:Dihydrofolate reductase [Pediococcus pentosaceus]|uniref:Dihydrofolate reductase n=1 Tax=Pediococcus pentosaceus TaxID=1255 RepID=A0A1Y0VVI9_PEDPE|nr:Dihydrofolate reductase [Pediococcus pentosaceus]